jgi:nitrate reductase gamma subunit
MDALAWETATRHLADNDYDEGRYCKIYDRNDFFTVLVQILLALFALVALWYKRLSENPRRTFSTWFMDIFKQALGACYAHVLNMVRVSDGG